MHEVITLHFGQEANYLGTHYWNTQESYFTYDSETESPIDHDRSFRQGIGADGSDTFTPRALIYDLKGAFGSLRRENDLYRLQDQQDPARQNAWGRSALAMRLPAIVESPYQQALNAGTTLPSLTVDNVRFWSDYNHIFYHPRSLVQLHEYEVNSSLMPFERYETGEELFNNLDREHDILDRDLRPFLEECDQIQGIQIFSSTTDAWSGFASRYLECIADELGKGSRWLFSLEQPEATLRPAQLVRLTNVAKAIAATHDSLSLHVPLSQSSHAAPSYLRSNSKSLWHRGALNAAVIDTLTLPARLRLDNTNHATFSGIEAVMNTDGRRPLAAASMKFSVTPRPAISADGDIRITNGLAHDEEPANDLPLDIDLFPHSGLNTRAGTSRFPRHRLFASYEVIRNAAEAVNATDDVLEDRFKALRRQVELRFPMLSSWPPILDLDMGHESFWTQARLTSGETASTRLRFLADLARTALPMDEREALYDNLSTMAEEYEESMNFGEFDSEDSDV